MPDSGAILIVGADGLLGQALVNRLRRAGGAPVIETTRRADAMGRQTIFLDLAQDPTTWRLPEGVTGAVLCAAVTSLERCRREPEFSTRINVHHTSTLAERLAVAGAFVVFPSTNLVFDGARPNENAETTPCPRTAYGRQKAAAERRLLALGPRAAVVRLTKVLGPGTPLLLQWKETLQHGDPIRPFSDRVMAPLPVAFVVEALARILERRLAGVFQLSGAEDIAYADAARRLAQRLGAPAELIQPILSADIPGLEPGPAHTTLDMTRARAELKLAPPPIGPTLDAAAE